MKFTKTFLAVAIAGIAAAPMMASATTTLSGAVQLRLNGDDTDKPGDFDSTKSGDARFSVGDVLMGVSAEQALNSGLTGYGSLRYDLNAFSNAEDRAAPDNVYVGVKGGFGDLRLGEVPNPGEYGQVNDIMTDVGKDIDQGVSYEGTFAGATVGAAYSPVYNQDIFAAGAKFAWQGLSIGVGYENSRNVTDAVVAVPFAAEIPEALNAAGEVTTVGVPEVAYVAPVDRSEDQKDNFSVKAGFAFAGASIELGYVSLGEDIGGVDDETAIVAKVGYSIAGVSLGLTYDAQQESEDNQVRLDAKYDLGGGMDISSRINIFSDATTGDDNEDLTDWRIQLSKAF